MSIDVTFNRLTDSYEVSDPVDIGSGVSIKFERSDGVIVGLFWDHGCRWDAIAFDVPSNGHVPPDGKWQLESLEPLTLSPSLLCGQCGKHGYIRDGRWVGC